MTYNPYHPPVLQALQELRAKTSARIDLHAMTYQEPFGMVQDLQDYLDRKILGKPRQKHFSNEEVVKAMKDMPCTIQHLTDCLGISYPRVWQYINGLVRVPEELRAKIMRILEGV